MKLGDRIARRFELTQEAGTGGMGRVFRALDHATGETIAVKVLERGGARITRRFSREADVLASLRHPDIVRYVAHGTYLGQPYLAMEWLDGEPLGRRFRRAPLSPMEAVQLVTRAASALGAAHARGIVHRDVKPSNLYLVGRSVDALRVLDFGVARMANTARPLTATGEVLGTIAYMAPEQALGQRTVDPRSDVFALGVVLYEALVGQKLFRGPKESVLEQVLEGAPPRARDIDPTLPEAIDEVLARVLSRDPGLRPANGAALAELLATLPRLTAVARLGMGEKRTVGIVAAQVSEADTVVETAIRTIVDAHGGATRRDGTQLIAVFERGRSGAEDVASAAHAALAIRDAGLPAVHVGAETVESGTMELTSITPVSTPGSSVSVDAAASRLLPPDVAVREEDGVLLVERAASTVKRSAFVGRERELATLEALFGECASGDGARVVTITGDSGSGKSRLAAELLEKLRGRDDAPLVLSGAGEPLGAGSPFAILATALRRTAAITGADPLPVAREKIRARLSRVIRDPDKLAALTPLVSELARVPHDTPAMTTLRRDATKMGDALRAAFEDYLAAECEARPVLLLLEDLHWGDVPTVRFVDSALRVLESAPLFVLVLARPEVDTRFAKLFAERRLVRMPLGRLPVRASAALVRSALGAAATDRDIGDVVDLADGNAFYLEELARNFLEQGTSQLPRSLANAIEARFRSLDEDARRVARAASVLGDPFSEEGLAALLPRDATTRGLATLIARDIIERRPAPPDQPDSTLAFGHALVREVAYALLTDEDRVRAHRLAGEWRERVGASDPLVLAEHFERGGVGQRAAPHYKRAAEQALEGNDFEAVLIRVEHGLACAPDDRELRGELYALAAEAHAAHGDLAKSAEAARSALERFEPGSVSWFRTVGRLCIVHSYLGEPREVVSWARRAAAVAPSRDTGHVQIACLCRALGPLYDGGARATADELLARAQEIGEALEPLDRVERGWLHIGKYWRAYADGDVARAAREGDRIVWAFSVPGEERAAAVSRTNLAYALGAIGEFERAESELRQSLAAAERMGIADVTASAVENLGYVLLERGRYDEARVVLERACSIADALASVRLGESARTYLARAHYYMHDYPEAERQAREAAAHASGNDLAGAEAQAVLAQALLSQDRIEEAHAVATAARGRVGDAELRPTVWLSLARTELAMNHHDAARVLVEEACLALEKRAARFTEETARAGYLGKIRVHADLFALRDAL